LTVISVDLRPTICAGAGSCVELLLYLPTVSTAVLRIARRRAAACSFAPPAAPIHFRLLVFLAAREELRGIRKP